MKKVRLGITHGDVNGVGYELIINTFTDARMLEVCTPIIYGSAKVAAYYRKTLNNNNVIINSVRTIEEINNKKLNLINCVDENIKVEIGKESQAAGEAAFQALEAAVKDFKAGKIDALVTCPINKFSIQSEAFNFHGHTDYLQDRFSTEEVLMFMVSGNLRVGLVTEHVPLSKVSALVTKEKIISKLKLMQSSLIKDFCITNPKIAVLSLNPHAGDKGVIGKEDDTVLIPAIEAAKEQGIFALGPFAADGFFGSANYKKFDAVLAMYHDQGLIPFKTIAAGEGVNYSAGLPIVRTSPAHGTAFDIAGKGIADFSSFRNAVYMACDIFKNRSEYIQLSSNPLKPLSAQVNLDVDAE
ncbi:MAG TPA: 4-hydroxythreonine-4-phosphate dehydrogenase PdxA [Bacteroidales bacterium]|nr:4-hydroxythreonine-4-phosphate dehydrogenase PdxA [Bacteroidales bacterium]